jgi:hypothetical protein
MGIKKVEQNKAEGEIICILLDHDGIKLELTSKRNYREH